MMNIILAVIGLYMMFIAVIGEPQYTATIFVVKIPLFIMGLFCLIYALILGGVIALC